MSAGETKEVEQALKIKRYPKVVSYVLYYIAAVSLLSYWLAGMVIVFILYCVGGLLLSREKSKQVADCFIHHFFKFYFRYAEAIGVLKVDSSELNTVDLKNSSYIVAANHPALWDAALLFCQFQGLSCIMKRSLLRNPLLGTPARWAHFIPNAPSLLFSRKASKVIEAGGSLAMFPEGTRSKKGMLNPFHWGIGLLAKRHRIPVLPVFIYSDSRFLEKGWPLWRAPELPIRLVLKSGEIQRADEDEEVKEFTSRLQNYFRDEIELQKPR